MSSKAMSCGSVSLVPFTCIVFLIADVAGAALPSLQRMKNNHAGQALLIPNARRHNVVFLEIPCLPKRCFVEVFLWYRYVHRSVLQTWSPEWSEQKHKGNSNRPNGMKVLDLDVWNSM
jgi:hypothetical protein